MRETSLGGAATWRPADAVTPAQLHAGFAAAFADYLAGPFRLPLDQWPDFLARQCVDLAHSRVAWRDGEVAAFALAAPRPEIGRWRLAAMGAVPAARGRGEAGALLDDFLARAAADGARAAELECFERNDRARGLYEGRGFAAVQRLEGWHRTPPAAAAPPAPGVAHALPEGIHALSRAQALAWLDGAMHRIPDLPIACTPRTLGATARPFLAWQSGDALLAWTQGPDGTITVASLIDPRPSQEYARQLLTALLSQHPDVPVNVPPLQRRDLGGLALGECGFTPAPLHQVLMVRPLGGSASRS